MKIPKGSRLDKIEASYGPLGEAVRCGLAGCGTPHQKGFVVVFRASEGGSPERALIGHVCGKREFKEIWTKAVARHNAELRAVEVRASLASCVLMADEIEPRLKALLPGLQSRNDIREALLTDAPDFMRVCINACRNHRGVIVSIPKWDEDEKIIHRLEGRLFFLQNAAFEKTRILLAGMNRISRLLKFG